MLGPKSPSERLQPRQIGTRPVVGLLRGLEEAGANHLDGSLFVWTVRVPALVDEGESKGLDTFWIHHLVPLLHVVFPFKQARVCSYFCSCPSLISPKPKCWAGKLLETELAGIQKISSVLRNILWVTD